MEKSRFKVPWGLLVFGILTCGPMVLGLGYALLYSLGLLGLLSAGFTWQHWKAVAMNPDFWLAAGFSVYIAMSSVVLSTCLALLAVLKNHSRWLHGSLSGAVYLPLTLPATVMAFLVFQWLTNAGLLSRLVYALGVLKEPNDFYPLVNDAYGLGIIIAHTLMATPFFIILFANVLQAERAVELQQVAGSLGYSHWQSKWRLLLPLLFSRSRNTLLLYGIFVFSSYEIPLLLGRQAPSMLSVFTIRKLQRYNLTDIPQAYTSSIFYLLLLLLIFFLWSCWRGREAGSKSKSKER